MRGRRRELEICGEEPKEADVGVRKGSRGGGRMRQLRRRGLTGGGKLDTNSLQFQNHVMSLSVTSVYSVPVRILTLLSPCWHLLNTLCLLHH